MLKVELFIQGTRQLFIQGTFEDKTEVLLVTAKQILNLQHLPKFVNINFIVLNSALPLGTWALLLTALFCCISML